MGRTYQEGLGKKKQPQEHVVQNDPMILNQLPKHRIANPIVLYIFEGRGPRSGLVG